MTTEQVKAMILLDLFQSEEFSENVRNPPNGMEYTYEAMKELVMSLPFTQCPSDVKPGTFPLMIQSDKGMKRLWLRPFEDKSYGVDILITRKYISIKVPNKGDMFLSIDGKDRNSEDEE